MKLLISGGRDFYIKSIGLEYLDELHKENNFTELVNGMATGIDCSARVWATENNIPVKEFPAQWNKLEGVNAYCIKTNKLGKKYNAKAGLDRNIAMLNYLEEGDMVIVFPGGAGSTHCLLNAYKRPHLNVINLMEDNHLIYTRDNNGYV